MKRWSVSLLVAAILAVGLVAQASAAIEVEGDAYVGVFDKYLWRGHDLSDGRAVMQAGADLSTHGFTLSYWSNWQLISSDALDSGEVTETDITLSYAHDFGDMLSVTVGDIWYQLEGIEDTNELFISGTVNTLLSPTLTMYYDWDACEEDGLFFTFDVSHSFDLMDNLALNLGAMVSYSLHSDYATNYDVATADTIDYAGFHNYELSVGLDYAISDQFTLSPSFTYSSGISSGAKKVVDTEILAGLNLAFSF